MYNFIFFTNVQRILEARHLSKNQLAKCSGISVSFLSDLTKGKPNPSLRVMEAISVALETPLPTLLDASILDEASRGMAEGIRKNREKERHPYPIIKR